MVMFAVIMVVAVTAVGAALRLEWGLHHDKLRAKAEQHLLDHMIGPDTKNLVFNLRRQMPVSQVPGNARKLIGILVPHFDDWLWSGLHLQPPAIFELQAISFDHRNRFRKVEKDIFSLICRQANAAAMARVEIEREGACCLFFRP